MITLVLMTAMVMQVLDTTIANVALPHMQGSMGATPDQIAWVLTSYIVASAVATPVTGWLAARLGRTNLFVYALIGFTLASTLCGIATSLPEMVLFRTLQGLSGAALVPLAQAILLDTYPRSEAGRAMGIFGLGVMIAPILGPTLGGFLTDQYSWRWCFYINVPLGILAILGALSFVPETAYAPARKLDWYGFGFLSLAIAGLQLVLDRGEQQGWFQSPEILLEATLSLFGLYMFVVHSATSRRPFLDTRLFTDRTFMMSTIITAIIFVVFYGSVILTPQLLQRQLNYPVMTAGMIMSPRGFGAIAAILLMGRVSRLVSPRILVGTGILLSAIALFMMSRWSLDVGASDIIVAGLLQGAGNGFINIPVFTLAFATLPTELRTEATGFFSLMRNIGSAIGVSVAASQLVESTQINHGYLSEFFTRFGHIPVPPGVSGTAALLALNVNITRQAGMVAYVNIFWLLGALCILLLPLVLFLKASKSPQPTDFGAVAD